MRIWNEICNSNKTNFICTKLYIMGNRNCDVGWLVGCFELNGPLRQYFSLYRAISQREGERGEMIDERKKCPNNPHPHSLVAK